MSLSLRTTGQVGTSSTRSQTGRRSVRVIMLDKKELIINVENKSARLVEVFNQVCQHVGVNETHYFGLALLKDGEFQFVANDTKLHKLAPKVWKSKECLVDEPLLTFHFRIQFYVDSLSLLKERSTRLQYYHQLRDNLLHYSQSVTEEKCFLLAGYALQAECGNFNVGKHSGNYFDPREFFPAWVVMRRGQDYLTNHMPTIHRDMSGMSHAEACVMYIREISVQPTPHNMHFYRLRRRKYDPPPGNVWLAICPKGLEIYEEVNDFKSHYSTFLWPHIGKLSCEKKKFEIVADGFGERRFVYFASSKESGESLLNLCRATHQFHLSQQPLVAELCRLEERDRRGIHQENYVHSECVDYSEHQSVSDRSRASSIPASSTRDWHGSGRVAAHGNAVRGASSPPGTSEFCTPGGRDTEIMINSPPRLSSSSLFKVTPISDDPAASLIWTPPSCYLPPGAESQQAASSGVVDPSSERRPALSTSNSMTSLKALVAVGRGSFVRSSASSTDGSVAMGPGGRAPLSLPKSLAEDDDDDDADQLVQRSGQIAATPKSTLVFNAASLQRNLQPGETIHDAIDKILAVDSRSGPPRKSSLIYPRAAAAQLIDASVMRSTSLRQPSTTRSNAEEAWPPQPQLKTAAAQSNLNLAPVAVEAHIQRIPFASPMTVISNPVQPGSVAQTQPTSASVRPASGSGRRSPPYVVASATNEPGSFTVGPLHSTPISRPYYQQQQTVAVPPAVLSHIAGSNFSASGQFGDTAMTPVNGNVTEPAANHDIAAGLYRHMAMPVDFDDYSQRGASGDFMPNSFEAADDMPAMGATQNYKQPPSYEASLSYKLAASVATPPSNHRYAMTNGAAVGPRQNYFTDLPDVPPSGKSEFVREPPSYFPNGIAQSNGLVGMQLPKQVASYPPELHNGRMNGFLAPPAVQPKQHNSISLSSKSAALSSSSAVKPHRAAAQPQRQPSTESADSGDDPKARCPQHGSRLDIAEMVRSIDAQSVPMLTALCNDRTLLNSCTCTPRQQANGVDAAMPTTTGQQQMSSSRRLSLSQASFEWDQPGTIVRPNSWSSDLQATRLLGLRITDDINIDGRPDDSPRHAANGFRFNDVDGRGAGGRGLVHRHSDGSSFQHAMSRHGQNHSDTMMSPPSFIAA